MDLTHGGFVGTPAFASPEQFERGPVDARVDIYSLGATLWFALTGLVPRSGSTIEEIRARHTRGDLPVQQLVARKVREPIIKLLRSMLAIDPSKRPAPVEKRDNLDPIENPGMWAVDHIDWFYRSHRVIGHRIPNYEIAQHLSTLLGLALLTVSVVHWYRTTPEHGTTIPALQPSTRWKIGALILLSAALFGFLRAEAVIGPYYFTVGFLANAVVAFVSFTLLELLLFSLLIRSRMRDLEPQDA